MVSRPSFSRPAKEVELRDGWWCSSYIRADFKKKKEKRGKFLYTFVNPFRGAVASLDVHGLAL